MVLKRILGRIGCALLVGLASAQAADGEVLLETAEWPQEAACDACATVQFARLRMRLPVERIGTILFTGGKDSALHLMPPSGSVRDGAIFLVVPPERLRKRFERAGLLRGLGVRSNEQLFDALGRPVAGNVSLAALRKIKGLDEAVRYTKSTRGELHAYRVVTAEPGAAQAVYFVIDGDETVYQLAGNVTDALYRAVLANLEVAEIP